MEDCVKRCKTWINRTFFLLNSDKTEILTLVTKSSCIGGVDFTIVKEFYATLDVGLSFASHVGNISQTTYYH